MRGEESSRVREFIYLRRCLMENDSDSKCITDQLKKGRHRERNYKGIEEGGDNTVYMAKFPW